MIEFLKEKLVGKKTMMGVSAWLVTFIAGLLAEHFKIAIPPEGIDAMQTAIGLWLVYAITDRIERKTSPKIDVDKLRKDGLLQ